jgi:hypothetical protein
MTPQSALPSSTTHAPRRLTRRRFLRLAGWGLVGGAIASRFPTAWAGRKKRRRLKRWSDPDSWRGGRVPRPKDVAVIRGKVLLDRNVRVAGVVVRPGSVLIFDPRKNRTLETTGNVVVDGKLVMRPRNQHVVHRLLFRGVEEGRFVGDGMRVLQSDVGLWVMDHGRLDVRGTPKLAWTRTVGSVGAGASSIELQEDPVGWAVGDEIVLTPTGSPAMADHSTQYDQTTIAAISGRSVQLSGATAFAHPAVDLAPGVRATTEVLNLSRNVQIEGSPLGRAHVFIHAMHPQFVQNAAIRHVGPRQPSPDGDTDPVLGRYGLHFHHCENGSRGSVVSGVVVREAGAHAFVPHVSHGITFTDCISHDTFEDAYWYDPRPAGDGKVTAPPTNDVLYDRCVASLVRTDPPYNPQISGYVLGAGTGNVARRCVGVGVQGRKTTSGFFWPKSSEGGVWGFEDCLAHNNVADGIFAYQNESSGHVISRFHAYHNGNVGIDHGAYRNRFVYEDSILYGNLSGAVMIHALSDPPPHMRMLRLLCDGGGLSDYAVVMVRHFIDGDPVEITGCTFRGYKKAAFACTFNENVQPDRAVLTDCTFEGNQFWLESNIHPGTAIRVQDSVLGNITLRRWDQPGVLQPEWNASVTPTVP